MRCPGYAESHDRRERKGLCGPVRESGSRYAGSEPEERLSEPRARTRQGPAKSAPARNSSFAVPLASVAEQELLSATVTGSPTALVVADLNGIALLWNPAAERLFGWSAAEVVGRPLHLIEFSSRGESHRPRRGAAAGHNVFEVQARRRHLCAVSCTKSGCMSRSMGIRPVGDRASDRVLARRSGCQRTARDGPATG